MAFVPENANTTGSVKREYDPSRKYPEPRAGSRKARISLIIDIGKQPREDFEDKVTGEKKPQSPQPQVIVFADLTHDVVDYGGEIGKAPYRLCLNNTYKGDVKGAAFRGVQPRDAEGNKIPGKAWTFHPADLLTKIAKAVQKPEVITTMDIEEFLNQAFMAQVEVKKTETDKKDADGNPIVYTNINYKGGAEIPLVGVVDADGNDVLDEDGNQIEKPTPVNSLTVPAMIIGFKTATVDQIKYIRPKIVAKIKQATNYAGSQMQKAIEQFEASKKAQQGTSSDDSEDFVPEVKETPKPAAKKAPVAAKKVVEPVEEPKDFDESPF